MKAIHKLAVREENTMVARFTLHKMVQEVDEPVRNFRALIKGQANASTKVNVRIVITVN